MGGCLKRGLPTQSAGEDSRNNFYFSCMFRAVGHHLYGFMAICNCPRKLFIPIIPPATRIGDGRSLIRLSKWIGTFFVFIIGCSILFNAASLFLLHLIYVILKSYILLVFFWNKGSKWWRRGGFVGEWNDVGCSGGWGLDSSAFVNSRFHIELNAISKSS